MIKQLRTTSTFSRVLAQIDSGSTDGFLKTLFTIILFYNEGDVPKPLLAKFNVWTGEADKFVAEFKLPKALFTKVMKTVMSNKMTPVFQEQCIELAAELQAKHSVFEKDNTISKPQLNLIKDCRLYLHKESEPAFKRLQKDVAILKEPLLNNAFLKEVEDQHQHLNPLSKIVKKETGEEGYDLTQEQRAEMKARDPEKYKEFLAHRGAALKVYQDALRAYVRESGKHFVDADELREHFADNDIVLHRIPEGFEGNIDENGKLYTKTGKLINGVPGFPVSMNPKYDPHSDNTYVFLSQPQSVLPDSQPQKYYTMEWKSKKGTEKFAKVSKFIDSIDRLRKRWVKDMNEEDDEGFMTKKAVAATIVEVVFETQARIGNPGSKSDGEQTYGISTLVAKQASVSSVGLRLNFPGKAGVIHKPVIKPKTAQAKLVIGNVAALLEGKKPSEYIFTYNGKRVTSDTVNQYLKAIGCPVTIHKFRTYKGTQLATEILANSPLQEGVSQSEAEKWYKQAMLEVGIALNHINGDKPTAMTAIQNYIDPALQLEFFKKLGLRTPSFLEKFDK